MKRALLFFAICSLAIAAVNLPLKAATPVAQSPKASSKVIDSKRGDVTGDRVPDTVQLLGIRKDPTSPFIEGLTLNVRNGKTGAETRIAPPVNSGYGPHLFLGDFTGRAALDVLLHIDTGGSGGFINAYLYTFRGKKPSLLFSSDKFSEGSNFGAEFRNNYRVEVTDRTTGTVFTIDINNWPSNVLSEIYTQGGQLLQPVQGEVAPLVALYPIVTGQTGVFRLLAVQRIIGRFSAESLGHVETLLAWNGKRFAAERVSVSTAGTTPEK